MKNIDITTKIIQSGVINMKTKGFVSMPIVQSSTFYTDSVDENHPYGYSRTNNPTRAALEESIALLEQGKYCSCFSSGIAAIHSVFTILDSGDEIIIDPQCYNGTKRLLKHISCKYNISIKEIDLSNIIEFKKNISENTRMVWIETPSNPMLKICDIKTLAEKCLNLPKILLVADNTFATPYFQNPLNLGVDIVVHSASKYLSGHSDSILGATVSNSKSINDKLRFCQNAYGSIPGPMDCFLTLRGLKTFALRMSAHEKNATQIANFLSKNSFIDKVFYPSLDESNQEIIQNQMTGSGGVVTFNLKSSDINISKALADNLILFKTAESLGGVESLVSIPALTNHNNRKCDEGNFDFKNSTIRLSVGIENIKDLIADINQAILKTKANKKIKTL